ncbi:MAG: hypothetical protein M3R55_13480 [Acidobacteriota bacterium]|nr:hypothetical protein [Acidobacteriota bacterium]
MMCTFAAAALVAAMPSVAQAQYSVPGTSSGRAVGETYWVEAMGGFWNPKTAGSISSEQFGIPGSTIDFVDDLKFPDKRITDFRLVLRPAKKHKFRLQYVPVSYSSETIFNRSITFNGVRYDVGLPVSTAFEWKVWRFGYEWDFVYREKFYVGAILEAKYTQVTAELNSPVNTEFTSAKAPIPSVGGVVRIYPIRNAAVTFELTGFKLPNIDESYDAQYIDWDLYGTFNVTNNFGVTAGYRVMDVMFLADRDGGEMKLKGLYFGGIARF